MIQDLVIRNLKKMLRVDLKSESIISILEIIVKKEIEINLLNSRAVQCELALTKIR